MDFQAPCAVDLAEASTIGGYPDEPPFGSKATLEVGLARIALLGTDDDMAYLTKLLMSFGYTVDRVQDLSRIGSDDLAVIVSSETDPSFEFCRMRSRAVPVMMISERHDLDFSLDARAAGIVALLQRPINPTEVFEWLSDFADQAEESTNSVLIVDDDQISADVSAGVLRAAGMTVAVVNEPRLVLDALSAAMPDLVLMDVEMPGVDGIRLTEAIRQTRRFVSMPIVFLSGTSDENRQFTARRLGGDDFLIKPVKPLRLIEIVRQKARRSRSMRSLIERDRLTSLYNPTSLRERFSNELERSARTGMELAFVSLDLDHFKSVNDIYGHATGDVVLRTLAGALKAGLRRADIVGRLGGEEFGLVLLDTSADNAAAVIERLRGAFNGLVFRSGETSFSVGFSAGVASSRAFGGDLSAIIAGADEAMYEVKRNGRNAVQIASPRSCEPHRRPTDDIGVRPRTRRRAASAQ